MYSRQKFRTRRGGGHDDTVLWSNNNQYNPRTTHNRLSAAYASTRLIVRCIFTKFLFLLATTVIILFNALGVHVVRREETPMMAFFIIPGTLCTCGGEHTAAVRESFPGAQANPPGFRHLCPVVCVPRWFFSTHFSPRSTRYNSALGLRACLWGHTRVSLINHSYSRFWRVSSPVLSAVARVVRSPTDFSICFAAPFQSAGGHSRGFYNFRKNMYCKRDSAELYEKQYSHRTTDMFFQQIPNISLEPRQNPKRKLFQSNLSSDAILALQ